MERRSMGAAILGLGLILSAVVFGLFFYRSRQPEKTIRVVGAATKRVESDVIKWRLTIVRRTGPEDLQNGYKLLDRDRQALVRLLAANGIPAQDLSIQPVNLNPIYDRDGGGRPVGYEVMQSMYLISHDLAKVERLALSPALLAEQGMIVQSSNLEYYLSQLSQIKRELLAEATRDAGRRAAEIAKSTGDRIGRISSARVGVFQITEPFSTEVSDYGIYNTATREKDITVTVSVVFNLR